MRDMSSVIVAKSDQINADDLVAGPRTIRIADVRINAGTEQPVSIGIDGDKKVWRPCKTASRLLVAMWGADASNYVGRSVTLYRDPEVTWAGLKVGGIRISHMSDIGEQKTVMLKESKQKSRPYIIKPLGAAPATQADAAAEWANGFMGAVDNALSADDLEAMTGRNAKRLEALRTDRPELGAQCDAAVQRRRDELSDTARRTDDQHGDQHDSF